VAWQSWFQYQYLLPDWYQPLFHNDMNGFSTVSVLYCFDLWTWQACFIADSLLPWRFHAANENGVAPLLGASYIARSNKLAYGKDNYHGQQTHFSFSLSSPTSPASASWLIVPPKFIDWLICKPIQTPQISNFENLNQTILQWPQPPPTHTATPQQDIDTKFSCTHYVNDNDPTPNLHTMTINNYFHL